MPSRPKGDAAGELDTGDGTWTEELRERYADRIQARIAAHAPNFESSILRRVALSPADIEAANPNMPGGDIYSGSCALDQNLLWRPRPGLPGHRTRVDGLWHIGASTHPGPGPRRRARARSSRRSCCGRRSPQRMSGCGEINTIPDVSAPRAFETLRTKLGEIHDLVKSASLLGWDQQVLMPSRGARGARVPARHARQARARALRLRRDRLAARRASLVRGEPRPRLARREPDPRRAPRLREGGSRAARAVGGDHARRRARFGVWVEARANSDYEIFRPWLEQLVELKHRYVECYPPADELYDTLLDDYEQGMKAAEVRAIFDRLKEVLIPLVEAAAPARRRR